MIICIIKVINPFIYPNEEFSCNALIDTGSDSTIVCNSIFEKFTIDKTKIKNSGLSTMLYDSKETKVYPFNFKIPENNWKSFSAYSAIVDLSKRNEYDVILGMNLIKNLDLHYSGEIQKAYLLS